MIITIDRNELMEYTSRQLNNLFPDKFTIDLQESKGSFSTALDRLEFCYQHVNHTRYTKDGQPFFNHLYSDHYLMYVWILANTLWKDSANDNLCGKLYGLNKSLYGFDCMYDTGLPDIFLIFHGVGTMLGKAKYADYFVALQGCTVGSQKGKYPVMGKGVSLTAHTALIGNCNVGDRATIAAYTAVFEQDVANDIVVFTNRLTGAQQMKQSRQCYAQQFFKINLTTL